MKDTFLKIPSEKRQQIILKAMIEFSDFGYEGSSTNRLVKTLGISKGSLFKYFETKLDMYSYLIDYTIDLLDEHMKDLVFESTTPKGRLVEYCLHEFDFLAKHPEIGQFLHRTQKDLNSPSLSGLKDHIVTRSKEINESIFNSIGLNVDSLLSQHLIIVITGYNRIFFDSIDKYADIASLKEVYITNLKKHLDLIVWSN